jgi:hypothetical protein
MERKRNPACDDGLTRREALRSAGGVVASILASGSFSGCVRVASKRGSSEQGFPAPHPLSGSSLYRDVVAYHDFGIHRTATDGDVRTTDWIARELRSAGLTVQFQPWRLRQFFLHESSLTVDGTPVDCFPAWLPRATGPDPIRAPLAIYRDTADARSVNGRVALVKFKAALSESAYYDQALGAVEAGAVAVLGRLHSASGEVAAINARAPHNQTPAPVPIVIVARKDEPMLTRAAEDGAIVSLVIDGKDEPQAETGNIIGRLERGNKLVVVSTPQSGWFQCAGERGPGIALFLGLARWASARESNASYLFVSTSGHELDNLGMHQFMETDAPPPEDVLCWIHLGASIAVWQWKRTPQGHQRTSEPGIGRHLVCSPDLLPVLTGAFEHVPGLEPRRGNALGELRHVMDRGYRGFGVFGSHYFFHTRLDTPETTAPGLLGPVGKALAESLETIEGTL